MAIRQYIGARYVPRFVGTYDATQIYDALDVVDNGSGTSYIARKTVPAGTPLTNTEYWFVYGASSGAIIQLQNDMIAAQGDILTLQGDVLTINNELDYIEEKGRRIITLTDSYGAHPSPAGSWQSLFTAIMGSGVDVYNFYASGIGVYHAIGGVNCEQLLRNNSGNIPDHGTITDVIVSMGGNDVSEALSDITTAFVSLIAYIRSEYPKARIHYAFPNYDNKWSYAQLQVFLTTLQHFIDLCGDSNVHYCSGMEYIMHNIKNVESDGVHPNSNGARELARGIAVCLKDGGFNYKASLMTTLTLTNAGTNDDVFMCIDGPTATIQLTGNASWTPDEFTFSNNVPLVIGAFADTLFKNAHCHGFGLVSTPDTDNPHFMMFTTNANNFYGCYYGQGQMTLTGMSINRGTFTMPTICV